MKNYLYLTLVLATGPAALSEQGPTHLPKRVLLNNEVLPLFLKAQEVLPVERKVDFEKSLSDFECRHLHARMKESLETLDMIGAQNPDDDSLLTLANKSLAEWSDQWQKPVAKFEATFTYPPNQSKEDFIKTLKLFVSSGISEISYADFSLLGLIENEIVYNDLNFTIRGHISAMDVCYFRSINLMATPNCQVTEIAQISSCDPSTTLNFSLDLKTNLKDSDLELRKK